MLKRTCKAMLDKRDEAIVILVALLIPLATLLSMVG